MINFMGGLIKCKDTYVNTDRIAYISGTNSKILPLGTSVHLVDDLNKELVFKDCKSSDFADAFVRANADYGIHEVKS